MNTKLIRALLLVLAQCDGQPIPESALITAAQLLCRADNPTDDDVRERLRDVEAQQFAAGLTGPLIRERTRTLTSLRAVSVALTNQTGVTGRNQIQLRRENERKVTRTSQFHYMTGHERRVSHSNTGTSPASHRAMSDCRSHF